jgi:hypothetical protein
MARWIGISDDTSITTMISMPMAASMTPFAGSAVLAPFAIGMRR